MKKGFTLIELLAVIVILSIIALISTPIIIHLVENSKKESIERSFEMYQSSFKNTFMDYRIKSGDLLPSGTYASTDDGKGIYLKSDNTKTKIEDFDIAYDGSIVTCSEIEISSSNNIIYKNCMVNNKVIQSTVTATSICKRATSLHTETCTQTHSIYYCSGTAGYTASGFMHTTIITYGTLGTPGTLTTGDAFDCDVNGDGYYDSLEERFYYVSPKDGDASSPYATLIYYNSVNDGEPSTNSPKQYYSTDNNKMGPVEGIKYLPTTTDWPNVSLSNTTRTIKDMLGGTIITFSYEGYAARFLTFQELGYTSGWDDIYDSDHDGILDSMNFVLENTHYSSNSNLRGFWLESPVTWNNTGIICVDSYDRSLGGWYTSNSYNYEGVRPAIEVLKTKIDY